MITMLMLAPLIVPLLGALTYLAAGWRPATIWVSALCAALVLAAAIALAVIVAGHGAQTDVAGVLRADALSVFMLIVIGAVGLLATAATPAWLRGEITAGRASARTAARHSLLVQCFLAAMALAVLAANLGVVWVAIEATTIVTAFLVGQRRTKAAVEAAWKYVVICSTGIALALLGVLLLNYAARHSPQPAGLDWAGLVAAAPHLDPGVTRIAVALLILGFGTKAGLAPLHAWLPDAHGQAPAPVSALMSGVLLSVAFSVILRVKMVSDAALGAGFARVLLAMLAVASLLLAASLLIRQRDYKRMLAYSSIEHMGLLALGAAAGGTLALAAVLLHMLGHGLAKGTLFLTAGRVLQTTTTSRIDRVRGLAGRAPVLAGCFGFGVLALIGLPPFSIFASELGIVRAGFATGLGWVTALALLLVLVIAAALIGHTSRMVLGTPDPVVDGPGAATAPPARLSLAGALPLVVGLAVCAVLGVAAGPLTTLLHLAAHTLTGDAMTLDNTTHHAIVDPYRAGERVGHRRTRLVITPDDLPGHAAGLLGDGFRVALIAGHHDQGTGSHGAGEQLRAVYLFTAADPDRRIELHVPLDPDTPHLPSLAGLSFPAGRFEREMRDLYGIVPDDHPPPSRLVRHFHWPQGWYPMLADAGDPPAFGEPDGPYPFRTVEGPGVFEIPVGPVHAGMIEPGHFRFSVVGETILNLKARLWFVHKGIEKLFQGRAPRQGIELAERISGDTAIGHTLAYCRAVEDALHLYVPDGAHHLRAVLLELERIYNHVGDLGALCNDVGHGILHAHAQRVREQLLRLNDRVTGHRLLRGAIHPGGACLARLPDPDELVAIGADIAEIVELALGHSVVRDRFTGTAVLTAGQGMDLGALGYVARASGLTVDARHQHPLSGVVFPRTTHSETGGDVLARFLVRAEEITASIGFIAREVRWLDGYRGTAPTELSPAPGEPRSGVGIVEGWRGTIVHRVEVDAAGRLTRVKVVDPSFFNWPALPVALADTIVPDFPLTNKSFNLSYAGNDL